jgi:hypothetical protein
VKEWRGQENKELPPGSFGEVPNTNHRKLLGQRAKRRGLLLEIEEGVKWGSID